MAPKRKLAASELVEPRKSVRTAPKSSAETKAQSAPNLVKESPKPDTDADSERKSSLGDAAEEKPVPKKAESSKKLAVGDTLPELTLEDDSGKSVSLLSESKEHGIVLFSYPAASTPGCTSQACSYRDNYEKITGLGYRVFGISTDTVNAQNKFKAKQGFPYPLLSDPKKRLLQLLGGSTLAKKTALRCHWVFEKGGILKAVEIGVKPKDCVDKAVKSIGEIAREQ